MLDSCDFGVSSTSFFNNIAGIGGALRYRGILPTFLRTLTFKNLKETVDSSGFYVVGSNKFKSNQGIIIADEIGGVFSKVTLNVSSDEFKFNQL